MARPLAKRKRKQQMPKVSFKKRKEKLHKKVVVKGNALIAANWDSTQTLSQNYKRLGLRARLNAPTGGTELTLKDLQRSREEKNRKEAAAAMKLAPGEARIERDESGNIVKISYGKNAEEALDEAEDGVSGEREEEEKTDIVKALEAEAALEYKRERTQSEREEEWIEKLVAKYGDDYQKMFWDKKLNPYQQTVGDIKRRVQKWKKKKGLA